MEEEGLLREKGFAGEDEVLLLEGRSMGEDEVLLREEKCTSAERSGSTTNANGMRDMGDASNMALSSPAGNTILTTNIMAMANRPNLTSRLLLKSLDIFIAAKIPQVIIRLSYSVLKGGKRFLLMKMNSPVYSS